jgi:N-acyl-D-amino-acid deacylase
MKPLCWFLPLLLLTFSSCETHERFDLLILNARIVDGTGNPWFTGDVGVRGERIAAMGHLSGIAAVRVVDAAGRYLAPGFIDMLGQSEYALLIDNRAMSKISQGITTEITGEGSSVAPQNERTRADAETFTRKYGLSVDWTDLDGYFSRLELKRHTVNIGTFVGATQVREVVIGFDNRPPSPPELDRMKSLVGQAMQQGALGLSTALVYAPAVYAGTPELIELAKVAGEHGGIYISHIRDERDQEIQALYEASDIGRGGRVPVEIWHLKVAGKQNWGKMTEVTRLLGALRADGIDISANIYPYTASATSLSASVPTWVLDGGREKMLERLRDARVRARIRKELESTAKGPENFYRGTGAEGIMLSSVENPALKPYEGAMLSAVAAAWKKHPIEALLDIIAADSGRTGAIYFSMAERDIRMAMAQPWVSFCTDHEGVATDGPLATGRPHPRAFGSFPRILGRYVRDEKVLTLEDAVRKMTSLPAQRTGLIDRGLLRPGSYADLVLFDLPHVHDAATYDNPFQYSEGIDLVVVNGQAVWEAGQFTGNTPGMILRGPVSR